MVSFDLLAQQTGELRKTVQNWIGRMELAVKEAEATASELNESLKGEVEILKAQLKEKGQILDRRDKAIEGLEANATGKLDELEKQVRDEILKKNHYVEAKDGRSEIDTLRTKQQEIMKLQEQIVVRLERLMSELQEKRFLLEMRERKKFRPARSWKRWKQWLKKMNTRPES